jgi:anti-anti-sigma regulatory factor
MSGSLGAGSTEAAEREQMDIQIELIAVDRTIAALRGELDQRSAAPIRSRLMALATGGGELVLDITDMTNRTGRGLERLAEIVAELTDRDCRLLVRSST